MLLICSVVFLGILAMSSTVLIVPEVPIPVKNPPKKLSIVSTNACPSSLSPLSVNLPFLNHAGIASSKLSVKPSLASMATFSVKYWRTDFMPPSIPLAASLNIESIKAVPPNSLFSIMLENAATVPVEKPSSKKSSKETIYCIY